MSIKVDNYGYQKLKYPVLIYNRGYEKIKYGEYPNFEFAQEQQSSMTTTMTTGSKMVFMYSLT